MLTITLLGPKTTENIKLEYCLKTTKPDHAVTLECQTCYNQYILSKSVKRIKDIKWIDLTLISSTPLGHRLQTH